jgi:hypothetical protein
LARRTWKSRLGRWLILSGALIALLAVLACFSGPIAYRIATARFEREAGPLSAARFAPPRLPASNPGPQLLRAGERTQMSGDDSKFLNGEIKKGPAAVLAQRVWITQLLDRNQEAIHLLYTLGDAPSSVGIDYLSDLLADRPVPGYGLKQLWLSRMVFAQGILAIADKDREKTTRAITTLARQAAVLEDEHYFPSQLEGNYAEKFELRLLLALAQSPEPLPEAQALETLVSPRDVRARFREMMAFEATWLCLGMAQELAKEAASAKGEGFPGWVGALAGRNIGLVLTAAAVEEHRRYLDGYDRGYAWIKTQLDIPGKKLSFFGKMRRLGGPFYPDYIANYRSLAASHDLIRGCLRSRGPWSAGATCQEIGRKLAGPFPSLTISEKDNGCLIRTVDRADYFHFFPPGNSITAPQECALPARSIAPV